MTVADPGRDSRGAASDDAARTADRQRSAQRERVFGEVLPESTSDDRSDAGGDAHRDSWGDRASGGGATDEWLRGEVPPHHG